MLKGGKWLSLGINARYRSRDSAKVKLFLKVNGSSNNKMILRQERGIDYVMYGMRENKNKAV